MIPLTITIKVAGPPRVAPIIETGRTYEWVQDKKACDLGFLSCAWNPDGVTRCDKAKTSFPFAWKPCACIREVPLAETPDPVICTTTDKSISRSTNPATRPRSELRPP